MKPFSLILLALLSTSVAYAQQVNFGNPLAIAPAFVLQDGSTTSGNTHLDNNGEKCEDNLQVSTSDNVASLDD